MSSKVKVNYWLTYSLLGVLGIFLLLVAVSYYQYQQQPPLTNSSDTVVEKITGQETTLTASSTEESVRAVFFPKITIMTIASTTVEASVAATWPERIKGLSDTPYLPEKIVKFFVFESLGFHSIWMKDMNYAIDILWVNEQKQIVDIEKNATPESYPKNFTPKVEALYVIETNAGFVKENNIEIGQSVILQKF